MYIKGLWIVICILFKKTGRHVVQFSWTATFFTISMMFHKCNFWTCCLQMCGFRIQSFFVYSAAGGNTRPLCISVAWPKVRFGRRVSCVTSLPWCTLYCQLITLWVVVIPSHCVYVSHSHNVIDLYIYLVVWFVFTTCNLLHFYKKTEHP